MSDINIFDDPSKVPKPKDQIRIESVKAAPYADRFRVYVEVSVTAFLERPNLILVLRDSQGKIVNEVNIIETMHAEMDFTIHIRNVDDPAGDYSLDAELFYETRNPPQDTASYTFTIPPADE
ncbi:MAG: hypothetical protein Q9P01_09705 [Anaerolineae bacterium]|nr:hypothetical protein [Anaerolineae bacterium]MDQ7035090.1 hypothetical protein [Anaerolineae bacterium]